MAVSLAINRDNKRVRSQSSTPTPLRRKDGTCPLDLLRLEQSGAGVAAEPVLNEAQRSLVQRSWARLVKLSSRGAEGLGASVLRRLLGQCAAARSALGLDAVSMSRLDNAPSFARHAAEMGALLDNAVEHVDRLDAFIVPPLLLVGAAHAPCQMRPSLWDALGAAIVDVLREAIGTAASHRQTLRAWTALVSFVCGKLRQGQESEARRMHVKQPLRAQKSHSLPGSPRNSLRSSKAADVSLLMRGCSVSK